MVYLPKDNQHLFLILTPDEIMRFQQRPLIFETAPACRSVQLFVVADSGDFIRRLPVQPSHSSADIEAAIAETAIQHRAGVPELKRA